MMKWIFLGSSILVGRYAKLFKAPGVSFLEHFSLLSRRIVLLFVLSIIASGLFASGIVIAINNWFLHYDNTGSFDLTGGVAGGLVLTVIGASTFYVLYNLRPALYTSLYGVKNNQKFWNRVTGRTRPQGSVIEEAISMLIADYIKEKEHKRNLARARMADFESTSPTQPLPFARSHRPDSTAI